MSFPKDFIWGVATSSYQIEGANQQYGRGECIWDRFSHTDGKVRNNDNGDIAVDHYNRYQEDVQLIKNLGVNAYRFSIAWARVLPKGIGETNPHGLDFYDRLVDELLANDLRPFATLYHWDLPQLLQDKGGWEHPDSVNWFCNYVELMTQRLGDRVKDWITHNEPFVAAILGNLWGIHAPGNQNLKTALKVAHHLLVSHGNAIPIIRKNVTGAKAGITLNLLPKHPATESEEDQRATILADAFQNRWYLDPICEGQYPQDLLDVLAPYMEDIDPNDVAVAAMPTDFLGINYYNRNLVVADKESPLQFREVAIDYDGVEHTAMGWEVYPDGLYEILMRISQEYAPPAIYITENGAAYDDPTPSNGVVADPKRLAYYRRHLDACERAIQDGALLKGYFAWSLLDNFEWAEGYSKRFGIYYVDFETLQRIPKESAMYYRDRVLALSSFRQ